MKVSRSQDRAAAQMTAQELLDSQKALRAIPPRKLGKDQRRRLEAIESELKRRCDAEDPELYRIGSENLMAKYSELLPPTECADVTPQAVAKLSNRTLQQRYQGWSSLFRFFEETFPRTYKSSDWLEESTINLNRSSLKAGVNALAREMIKRGIAPSSPSKLAQSVSQPSIKANPEVARRRAIIARHAGLSALKLCSVFDAECVPVLWEAFTKWTDAYRDKSYKPRIETMISRDRRKRRS